MLYICSKFCENTSKGFPVTEWRLNHDGETDAYFFTFHCKNKELAAESYLRAGRISMQ